MAYTKLDFINSAFDELGLASYVYNLSPEDLTSCLHRLDAMIAAWSKKGIRLGYPLHNSKSSSSINESTSVPAFANETVITNLAIRIAPSYGKVPSQDTKNRAAEGYNDLISDLVSPRERQLKGSLPLGAGSRRHGIVGSPFVDGPVRTIATGSDSIFDFR